MPEARNKPPEPRVPRAFCVFRLYNLLSENYPTWENEDEFKYDVA
jgi:hypothetical protein